MIANSLCPIDALKADEDTFIDLLLLVDPKAEYTKSRAYSEVRRLLVDVGGWYFFRFDATVARLVADQQLFISRSKKTISMAPIVEAKGKRRLGSCVYCGRESSKITRDHIVPRAKGGSDRLSNIVLACRLCNEAKGDRTPQQWARDVLRYRCHVSPDRSAAAAWFTLRSWAIRLAVLVAALAGKGGAS